MRKAATILMVTSLVTMVFLGFEPSAAEDPEGAQVIGEYHQFGSSNNLTTSHTSWVDDVLEVEGPLLTDKLKVETSFLEGELGAWSSDREFTVAEGVIEFDSRDVSIVNLSLGQESVFTMGASDQIEFLERPMWVSVEQAENGDRITLDMEDGNTDAQKVFISRDWLWERGIQWFNVTHEDGALLTVTEHADGVVVDVPHFSKIHINPDGLAVDQVVGGLTVENQGETRWFWQESVLEIDVDNNPTGNYEVLISADWPDVHLRPHTIHVYASGNKIDTESNLGGIKVCCDGSGSSGNQYSVVFSTSASSVMIEMIGEHIPVYSMRNTELTPHWGQKQLNETSGILEIEVGKQSSDYEVWAEKSWLDMKIPYLALEEYSWETMKWIGIEYYNVSLTSEQTPNTLVYETFDPSSIPEFTWGNPTSIELWNVENETFPTLPPMFVEMTSVSPIFVNITIPAYYPVRINQTWLESLGVDDPSVIIHDNRSKFFTSKPAGDLIVLVDSNATVEIQQDSESIIPLGRVEFIDTNFTPEYSFPSFHFLPEEYDPFHPFEENATIDDFVPPRSLVLEDIGVFGDILDPQDFVDLGVGLDFLPSNTSNPYEVGIWIQDSNLNGIHENLSLGYDQLKNERDSLTPFIFRYGQAMIPLDEPMDMWNSRAENTIHSFGNPYAHGPVKDRLYVPLAWLAGGLSLCKLEQECQDTRDLEFNVYENGVASPGLTQSLSGVLLNVTKCLEESSSCPVSDGPIVEFVKSYRQGILNGTFSDDANITIDVTENNNPITCAECGLDDAVEEIIRGTRRMVNAYSLEPSFELTPEAMIVLGCRDPENEQNQTFEDCEYQEYLDGHWDDEIFPYLDAVECVVDEVVMLLDIVVDPVLGMHVSIDQLDLQDCLGLGDSLDLGSAMLPDIFDCTPVSGMLVADCPSSGNAVNFLWNMNPLNYLGTGLCPSPTPGFECAVIGTALAIEEVARHTGKVVAPREIDIGGMPCRGAALSQMGIDKHPDLHDAGNSAFYLTFSPWYCFDNSGDSVGHAGKARNFPISNHIEGETKTPVVVWMWSAAAPWLGPHEFGHAFGPEHADGACTETGFFSSHPLRPHATHMKFTGDKKTKPECQYWPVWLRHLHLDYTPDSEGLIEGTHEAWKTVPASAHESLSDG